MTSEEARAASVRMLNRSEGLMDSAGSSNMVAGASLVVAAAGWAIVAELAAARESSAAAKTTVSGTVEVKL